MVLKTKDRSKLLQEYNGKISVQVNGGLTKFVFLDQPRDVDAGSLENMCLTRDKMESWFGS